MVYNLRLMLIPMSWSRFGPGANLLEEQEPNVGASLWFLPAMPVTLLCASAHLVCGAGRRDARQTWGLRSTVPRESGEPRGNSQGRAAGVGEGTACPGPPPTCFLLLHLAGSHLKPLLEFLQCLLIL